MDAYRADMHDQIVIAASSVTADLLDRLASEYKDIPIRDVAGELATLQRWQASTRTRARYSEGKGSSQLHRCGAPPR